MNQNSIVNIAINTGLLLISSFLSLVMWVVVLFAIFSFADNLLDSLIKFTIPSLHYTKLIVTSVGGQGSGDISARAANGKYFNEINAIAEYAKSEQGKEIEAAYIAATAETESTWSPEADSGKAWGIMQLSYRPYQTWHSYNNKYNSEYSEKYRKFKLARDLPEPEPLKNTILDDRFNAEYSLFLGTMYHVESKDYYKKWFAGRALLRIMAIAYNGGGGAGELAREGTNINTGRLTKETREYEQKVMNAYDYYSGFQTKHNALEDQESELIGEAASNPASARIKERVAKGYGGQCTSTGCAKNILGGEGEGIGILNTEFGSGNWSYKQDYYPGARGPTLPPSASDLDHIRSVINNGDLFLMHVKGEASGEHWILVTGIDQTNNIEFYDPNGGQIRTLPYNQQSTLYSGAKVSYFGMVGKEAATQQNMLGTTIDIH